MWTKLNKELFFIRTLHTTVWLLLVAAIFYVFYCGVTNKNNTLTQVAIVSVFVEMIIYSLFKWTCPLHIYAQKITKNKSINDTFLPHWFFYKGHNIFFTVIFFIGLFLVLL